MIQEKTCPHCGSNLKYDTVRQRFSCPFCGKAELETVTLEDIDKAIGDSAFPKAKEMIAILEKETPDDPRLSLRRIYCKYQCQSVGDLLSKNRKIAGKLETISNDKEWDVLAGKLDGQIKNFVMHVRKYCTLSLRIREAYEKINASTAPYRNDSERPSTKPGMAGYKAYAMTVGAIGVMMLVMDLFALAGEDDKGMLAFVAVFGAGLIAVALGILYVGNMFSSAEESTHSSIERRRLSESEIEKKKAECESLEAEADSLLETIREEENEIG